MQLCARPALPYSLDVGTMIKCIGFGSSPHLQEGSADQGQGSLYAQRVTAASVSWPNLPLEKRKKNMGHMFWPE
eukprot:1160247-Pelagomonas_calceolata.AAC.22